MKSLSWITGCLVPPLWVDMHNASDTQPDVLIKYITSKVVLGDLEKDRKYSCHIHHHKYKVFYVLLQQFLLRKAK